MRREPVAAVVAVGANLGDAQGTVRKALLDLSALSSSEVRASSLWRSAPVQASGPDFINAVAEFQTRLTAPDLLLALQALETAAGRERPYANAPRTLDLDLIFYGDAQIQSPRLTVPHPRWHERAFVLMPLSEVQPGRVTSEQLQAVARQQIAKA